VSSPARDGGVPMPGIAERLLAWFDEHGRHDLPWQIEPTPYSVWVSEIMLQQTQVATVVRYYDRFMRRFPTVAALASADLDSVLTLWSGLGYYARGRNLWRAARIVAERHGGHVPLSHDELMMLPGIGRSTAGAILALSTGQRWPILDGNVKRVLARHGAVAGWPGDPAVARELWRLAEQHTPETRVADYTQAIMDLGATLCTRARPACTVCPLATDCRAAAEGLQPKFPAPRPRRARPQRRVAALVIRDASGCVLLERRPVQGIWGGLHSLPELPAGESAAQWCARQLGVEPEHEQALPTIEHGFTHFDLDIEPKLVRLAAGPRTVMDRDDRLWYKPGTDVAVGVPAPIAALLESLEGSRLEAAGEAGAASEASGAERSVL
jgi:A/G-specific adenine glycosylase